MVWKLWVLLTGMSLTLLACERRTNNSTEAAIATTDFAALLRRFKQRGMGDTLLPPPVIYRDSTFADEGKKRQLLYELRLADRPLGLQHQVVQLRGHGYPVSYSVIFQGCLVALFKNGEFGCYRLPNLVPDAQLERHLNVNSWQRHWLINGQLVAQRAGRFYAFSTTTHAWQLCNQAVPFNQQPKLYEDTRYLVYADCHGEFGGTAYFYNKQTSKTHRVGATCANSVWQENGQYRVLASLGHMIGGAGAVAIADPELLPLASTGPSRKSLWQYDSVTLSRQIVTPLFDFHGLQLFGALRYQHQTLYLMHWRNTTFLVTIAGKQITIVDPLFANNLYTHNPITTAYGPELALTNLDFYGLGGSDEVAALLWQGQQVTKIEWGEQPEEMK